MLPENLILLHLSSLHKLSIHVRSDFKGLLMPHKFVNRLASSYPSELIKPYIPPPALCFQNIGLQSVPRVKRSQSLFLPADIRHSDSTEAFKSKPKTHLFALTSKMNECSFMSPLPFQVAGLSLHESFPIRREHKEL